MTDTPEADAGWYPDGTGQLRYYDGAAWTQHVHPMDDDSAVETAATVDAENAQTVAPIAVVEEHGGHERPSIPIYRRPWLIAVVAFVTVLVVGAGVLALSSDDGSDPVGGSNAANGGTSNAVSAPSTTVPTQVPVAPASPVTYGASPTVVAAAAGCTDVRSPEQAEAASPVKYQRVTCTLAGATVEVDTYPAAGDQRTAEAALVDFIGTGKYASGEGWIAVDEKFGTATAQSFATLLGGEVKGA